MTDKDRVARKLMHDGQVRPRDFRPPTCDGGTPTSRLAARVRELREDGWQIKTEREGREARYVLCDSDVRADVPSRFAGVSDTPVCSDVGTARAEDPPALPSAGTGSGPFPEHPSSAEPVPLFVDEPTKAPPRGPYEVEAA